LIGAFAYGSLPFFASSAAWLIRASARESEREGCRSARILAENIHEIWAMKKIKEGWTWGPSLQADRLQSPNMVTFE
jgi:hypothetical protein